MIPGIMTGMTIAASRRGSEAPSTSAASSYSTGTSLTNPSSIQMANGSV